MIVLKNLEIEESLIKPSVTLRKSNECAYCGKRMIKGGKATKASFRYSDKLYPLYFHNAEFGLNCFLLFNQQNIKHDDKNRNNPTT